MRSLVLVFTLLFASAAIAQDNVIELRNADVLAMIAAKVPVDAIITKIQTSRCNFDTFPPVISELRYRGVPEDILIAMVEAPFGRPTRNVPKQPETVTKRTETPEPLKKITPVASGPGVKHSDEGHIAKTEKTIDTAASVEKTSADAAKVTQVEKASLTQTENASISATAKEKPGPSPPVAEQRVLTNNDLMTLLHRGLASNDVAAAIRKAPGSYDFSAPALHALQEAGADAFVFLAMMEVSRRTEINNKPQDNKPKQ
jgi:hypothetical protein